MKLICLLHFARRLFCATMRQWRKIFILSTNKCFLSATGAVDVDTIVSVTGIMRHEEKSLSCCFEPSQPRRITPGLETNVICLPVIPHKSSNRKFLQHPQNLSRHRYETKSTYTPTSNTKFRRNSQLNITPVQKAKQKHVRLWHDSIADPSVWFINTGLINIYI